MFWDLISGFEDPFGQLKPNQKLLYHENITFI